MKTSLVVRPEVLKNDKTGGGQGENSDIRPITWTKEGISRREKEDVATDFYGTRQNNWEYKFMMHSLQSQSPKTEGVFFLSFFLSFGGKPDLKRSEAN